MSEPQFKLVEPKPVIWNWDVLGNPQIVVFHLPVEVSWWKRFWTRVFFGSKWKRRTGLDRWRGS